MEQVKELIEGYSDLMERKQILYSRLLTLGGENPLREESIYVRLEEIEQKQVFILDMIFESTSLSDRESVILDRRSLGMSLREIGGIFNLTGERIRGILDKSYEKLAAEFEKELSGA